MARALDRAGVFCQSLDSRPPAMEKDTVAIHFVRAAVARLDAAARARVLEAAGIPTELLDASQARVTAGAFAALWLAVARELDDEFFGLDRRRMKVGSFNLLCQAALGAHDLEQALRRMLRGFGCFLDDVRGELLADDEAAVIRLHNRIADREARRFADETYLTLVHGLMCWLVGQRIPLRRADFAWPCPPHFAEYAAMYCQSTGFNAPATALHFEPRLLTLPVVQDERSLSEFLRTAPQSVFLKYRNEDGWAARLRRRLRGCIEQGQDWPLLEEVAAELHLAPATLRRRLLAEGSSYQAIKDSLRRDAAIHQLSHSQDSVAEIGLRLGFQDASAFHRAFKKWLGVQPGEYRVRLSRGSEIRP